jgi:hypothetical protein
MNRVRQEPPRSGLFGPLNVFLRKKGALAGRFPEADF